MSKNSKKRIEDDDIEETSVSESAAEGSAKENLGMARGSVKKSKKMSLKKKIILFTVLGIVGIIAGVAIYYLFFFAPEFDTTHIPQTDDYHPNDVIEGTDPSSDMEQEQTTTVAHSIKNRKKLFYNILVVGRDAASASTDVIMLVSFDVTNKTVSALQIPRDTYIKTTSEHKKINSAYGAGYNSARARKETADQAKVSGVESLKTAVSAMLGVPIDRYIFMDLTGFRNIVDIVGGVELYVPFAMKYDDPTKGMELHIDIAAGQQTLNGDKAEQFVRWRKNNDGLQYAQGDIGRIQAQKTFLTALVNKMKNVNIKQATEMVNEVIKHVITNCALDDMVYFASKGLAVDTESIRFHTLPGEGQYINGTSYYVVYQEDILDIVNTYYNPYTYDITLGMMSMDKFIKSSGSAEANKAGETVKEFSENNHTPGVMRPK